MQEDSFYSDWSSYISSTWEYQEKVLLAGSESSLGQQLSNEMFLPPPPIPGTREECVQFSSHFNTCSTLSKVKYQLSNIENWFLPGWRWSWLEYWHAHHQSGILNRDCAYSSCILGFTHHIPKVSILCSKIFQTIKCSILDSQLRTECTLFCETAKAFLQIWMITLTYSQNKLSPVLYIRLTDQYLWYTRY